MARWTDQQKLLSVPLNQLPPFLSGQNIFPLPLNFPSKPSPGSSSIQVGLGATTGLAFLPLSIQTR